MTYQADRHLDSSDPGVAAVGSDAASAPLPAERLSLAVILGIEAIERKRRPLPPDPSRPPPTGGR